MSRNSVRDLVWDDVRVGAIRPRDLPPPTRALVWFGLILIAGSLGGLVLTAALRSRLPLIPLPGVTEMAGRGSLAPIALVPATLLLLAISWSLLLVGALRCHAVVRLGAFLAYSLVALDWTRVGQIGLTSAGERWLGWMAVAAVPVLLGLRWRGRQGAGPVPEFAILLLSTSTTFGLGQAQLVEDLRVATPSLLLGQLDLHLRLLVLAAGPLLLYLGIDIALFAHTTAGKVAMAVTEKLPRWAPWLCLALVGWRLRDVTAEAMAALDRLPLSYAGALGIPLAVGLVWWVVGRGPGQRGDTRSAADEVAETAKRNAVGLILAFCALQLLIFLVVEISAALSPQDRAVPVLEALTALTPGWRLLLYCLAIAGALWLRRRGSPAAALYVGIFGAVSLWHEMISPGRPLERLGIPSYASVDFWWVVLFAVVGLVWLVRRSLTPERSARLLWVVLLSALVRQTDLSQNPRLQVTGAGLIAFAVVWQLLTNSRWANGESPWLPHAGRALLYLGYILFAVTILNWFFASRNHWAVGVLHNGGELAGLHRFGLPLVFAVFAVALSAGGWGAGGQGEDDLAVFDPDRVGGDGRGGLADAAAG